MGLQEKEALELLLQHRVLVIAYAHAVLRDFHEAEDVFQEVAVLVLEKRQSIRDRAALPGWMRTAARFKCLKRLEGKRAVLAEESLLERMEPHWARDEDRWDTRCGILEALDACLDKLTQRARRLVDMRFGQKKSGREIAALLGQPPNTVYVGLSRIYGQLRQCLGREEDVPNAG